MGVFLLPKSLCQQLNQLMNHKERFTSWMSWSKLGRSKQKGGLRFKDVEVFNLALLAKQGWRIIQYPDSLVARIMREKYFPSGSFLTAPLGKAPSFAWQSIHQARKLLDRGLVWRVGNGEKIAIWGDRWLPNPPSNKVHSSTG
jgi:hypothetical protein